MNRVKRHVFLMLALCVALIGFGLVTDNNGAVAAGALCLAMPGLAPVGLSLGALDPTLAALYDADLAETVAVRRAGQQHALERLRGNFDQDGRAVGAAIASVMLQASLPEQAMDAKLADRTPSPPAAPEYPNPPAQLNPAAK